MSGAEKLFNIHDMQAYPDYQDMFNDGPTPPFTNSRIDAIIVPQARSALHILGPAWLAYESDTVLMSMCSHETNAAEVGDILGSLKEWSPPVWYAVDIPPGYEIPGVKLRAQEEIPPQARKDEDFNLPEIRDSGLVTGKMIGSNGIFYHDDDERVERDGFEGARALLNGNDVAALKCADYPNMADRSGIQHGKRETLYYHLSERWYEESRGVASGQGSGAALAVNPQIVDGHFVRGIYNEDTIFMHPSVVKGRAGLTPLHFYFQNHYNPFQPERTAQEEFGDLVHDGLYKSLRPKRGGVEVLYTQKYWQAEIESRRREYDKLLSSIEARRNPYYFDYSDRTLGKDSYFFDPMPEAKQAELRTALLAGLAINETLNGKDFVNYIRVWDEDRKRWNKMMSNLPQGRTIKQALAHLGLTSCVSNV